jgi:Dolichyl-phosphate-mannose-protein mannosyltransferase
MTVPEPPRPILEPGKLGATEPRGSSWVRIKVALAVVGLLGLHVALAVNSLLQENATVDETLHLPAGVSYWQTGTFKLYHHNPPLVKLVAALPVIVGGPKLNTDKLYTMKAWEQDAHINFGQYFALENAGNFFEIFDRARLMMPLFSVLGGLVVFAWSSRLYGPGGGLLSLALWCLCPNILANGRLITSDVAAASIGAGATYLFWRYQKYPTWSRAALAGLALGLAQLTKFSLILLYGLWPALAVMRFLLEKHWEGWPKRLAIELGQWALMVALSVLVIDLGYGFEGVGTPLGRFEFACQSLTVPVTPGMARPDSPNRLLEMAWRHRVNRFRGTLMGVVPSPLPRHYLLGFDEQKLETEGIPEYYGNPTLPRDDSKRSGYPVYLDGELRRGGWWYYYLATLAYKVPEGTWALVALSGFVLIASKRSRAPWADEVTILAVPVAVLAAMSFLTDICLGLRYILPIFPYVFITVGKVVPWAVGMTGPGKWVARALIGASLLATSAATATIHPDYLAYFNWASGGPDRGAEHLIDSNLDWGQDLVKLDRWLKANHPGKKVGLAYFGQINPSLLALEGRGFDWFLPPPLPGTLEPTQRMEPGIVAGPAPRLTPGLYAISASIVRGLPWRFYDRPTLKNSLLGWMPAWNAPAPGAYSYFQKLTPVARVGHSIYVYDVTEADCQTLAPLWARPKLESEAEGASSPAGSRVDPSGSNRHSREVQGEGLRGPSSRRSPVGSDDSVFRRETDDVRAVSRELAGDPSTPGHAMPGGQDRLQRDGLSGSPDSSR